jgi:hypothetical protein
MKRKHKKARYNEPSFLSSFYTQNYCKIRRFVSKSAAHC